jgi:DNA polymerase-3 subunit delta'
MAQAFVAGLQCTSSDEKPCGECVSCKQVLSGNQPDVIWVHHDNPSIGVEDIRTQLNDNIAIKPFSSKHKIYIVEDAERMTEAAQNALLKTIEEPPEYGIIILLTSNINLLLPTIQSRCIKLEFRPLSNLTVERYLLDKCHVPDYLAKASAVFAQGNLGKAIRYARSEDFIARKDEIINLLKMCEEMTIYDMQLVIKSLSEDRSQISDYIDLMILWYRDVLLFKATKDVNQLLFREEYTAIASQASKKGYESIENILQALDKAKVRLKANVNFDLTMELMFLTMKD